MKNWNAKLWLAALALLLPSGVGGAEPSAAATPTDEAPSAVGTLTLQWSLSGRRDPIDCGGLGVERFVVSLRSSSSSPADEEQFEGPCDAFQISIDLSPGSYAGDALLVDRFARPVTLSVPLDSVEIVAGRDVVKSIDFPVAAFL